MATPESEVKSSPVPNADQLPTEQPEIEDENSLALEGVVMLLNNKWDESIALYEKHKSHSLTMHFGAAFVSYMQAMMSMEDERISDARKGLDEVEKKCKTFKKVSKKGKNGMQENLSQEDKWTCQIIAADVLLYQAILTFINQDIPSYVKGGWLLRKAWKVYEKVYADISQHYTDSKKYGKVKVKVDQGYADILNDEPSEQTSTPTSKPTPTDEVSEAGDDGLHEMIPREAVSRLLGAVSFGYGMFQLGISMLPEKVLKLIEFLGFHGDRKAGLSALEFSMNSADMRAPLAVLSVLWYHVIMKPFFTNHLSEEDLMESTKLIDRFQNQYPESSVLFFFKGRLCRLKKNLDAALEEYEKAKMSCSGQKELKNAALFEIAWCQMMKANYSISYDAYTVLAKESVWSTCFYTYMLAICAGSQGKQDESVKLISSVPGLVKKKTNQIEAFVSRRAQQFKKIKLSQSLCQLLILELVYMWNSLTQISQQEAEKMISTCNMVEEKKFFHLRSLIEGAIYKHLGDWSFSEQCFKEAIARQEGMKHDHHVAAHAMFELGSHYFTSTNTKEDGRKMLLKAKDGFKEYDFENRLNVRIRNILRDADPPKK